MTLTEAEKVAARSRRAALVRAAARRASSRAAREADQRADQLAARRARTQILATQILARAK